MARLFLAVVIGFYLVVCITMAIAQRSLLYFPHGRTRESLKIFELLLLVGAKGWVDFRLHASVNRDQS